MTPVARRSRAAVASLVIVVVVVLVFAVVGGAYYLLSAKTTVTTTNTGTSHGSVSVVTSVVSSSGSYENYRGMFTYTTPLGPTGENASSGKVVQWNSTMVASGTFAFSVNTLTYTGTGTGQGSLTVTTRGYCSGTVKVPYSFTINAVHAPGESYIISFNIPTPPNVMVQLTCQGSTRGFYTANNPIAFLSVYPNGLSVKTFPTTQTQAPTNGISYSVTITPA